MFGMNKNSIVDSYNQLQKEAHRFAPAVSNASDAELYRKATQSSSEAILAGMKIEPAKRPGDTPPRQFVGKTLDTLKSTLQTYIQERELLAKDIAKLTEEQSQLDEAIAAVQAAYDRLKPTPQFSEAQLDDVTLEALRAADDGNINA